MAKTKVPVAETLPTTRKVRVNKHETYEEIRPVENLEPEETADDWADPFSDFHEIITDNQQATIHIWRLPNYEVDGRTSPNGTDREYCGSVIYQENDDSLLHQIHQRVPAGGVVSLELRANGAFQSRGLLKIAKPSGQVSHPADRLNPSFIINQPAQQSAPGMSSMEMVTQQFDMVEKVVGLAQRLIPPAPVINTNGSTQTQPVEEKPSLQERLLETVVTKALETNQAPLDKVLDALSGRSQKEPSWFDSFGPVLVELAKGLTPVISMSIQQYMRTMAQTQVQAQGATVGQQPQGAEAEQPQAQLQPPVDPAERAWRRVVQRLLEDCFEHVSIITALSQVSSPTPGDGVPVMAAAESIAALADRFQGNEQIIGMIQMLLGAEPAQVVEICAMLQPREDEQTFVLQLKESPVALAWLGELQVETKKILSGEEEQDGK